MSIGLARIPLAQPTADAASNPGPLHATDKPLAADWPLEVVDADRHAALLELDLGGLLAVPSP